MFEVQNIFLKFVGSLIYVTGIFIKSMIKNNFFYGYAVSNLRQMIRFSSISIMQSHRSSSPETLSTLSRNASWYVWDEGYILDPPECRQQKI